MARLRLLFVVAVAFAMTACPNATLPENTISFTLDGVEYSYSASFDLSTHAWGRGTVYGSLPPSAYLLTASATAADAEAETNTIEISFSVDGVYYLSAYVFDAVGAQMNFYLGAADEVLLADIVRNLDVEGEQMQGAFVGTYTWANGSTHTLTNLVFSVERLTDYYAPQ
jgi:hypothetical protein